MEDRPRHGGLRVAEIPALIGAVPKKQKEQHPRCGRRQDEKKDMKDPFSPPLPPGQLEIDDLQLFGNGPEGVGLRRWEGFAQKGADRGVQRLGQGQKQVGVWDGKPRFP